MEDRTRLVPYTSMDGTQYLIIRPSSRRREEETDDMAIHEETWRRLSHGPDYNDESEY